MSLSECQWPRTEQLVCCVHFGRERAQYQGANRVLNPDLKSRGRSKNAGGRTIPLVVLRGRGGAAVAANGAASSHQCSWPPLIRCRCRCHCHCTDSCCCHCQRQEALLDCTDPMVLDYMVRLAHKSMVLVVPIESPHPPQLHPRILIVVPTHSSMLRSSCTS